MARAKKKKLSLEELLEQALVKEEDRPYEVPENWVWTNLENVIELISGRDVKVNLCNDNSIGIPYILGASNLENNVFIAERWIEVPQVVSKKDDILISVKGTIGKVYLQVDNEINISRQIMALRAQNKISVLYLKNFIDNITDELKESGNGLIPGISRGVILKRKIPLPPIAEQQRIVDTIESLFEKLDTAKELTQNALDSFENRKAAILHKAFTGELTAKWREENGVSLDEWESVTIKELTSKLNQGWSPKCESFPSTDIEKWGVIKTTAIQHMKFVEEENKQLPVSMEPRTKHELKAGDILITRAGPRIRVGVCCMIKQVRPRLLLCDKAYRFNAKSDKIMAEYLVTVLNTSDKLNEINKMKTGISDSGVNLTQKGFLDIRINVPSLQEQQEIVNIADNLLENEQQAKKLYNVIEKIDLMKKVILARAFRGELGTNDPEEESAVELLKEVLKEKI